MRFALALGVDDFALSYYGKGSIESAHLKSHTVGQGVQRKVLYDEPLAEQYDHCRSYPHNLGRYSYLFSALRLRRLDIQVFDIPSLVAVSDHLSNSGVTRLCRELDLLCLLQRTWLSLRGLVACLSAYLLRLLKSWLASLESKGYPLKLVYPYGLLKSLPLLQDAKRGYLSYFLVLHLVVFSYLIIPQARVGCKP